MRRSSEGFAADEPARPTAPSAPTLKLDDTNVAQAQPEEELKAPTPEEPKPAEAEKPTRDLAEELRAAIGSPVHCLKPRPASNAPPAIQVDLEAHLIESGMVTRGYARSSQLEEGELECIEKLLGGLRLTPPIEEAPRSVSSSIEFKLKVAEAAPKPAG